MKDNKEIVASCIRVEQEGSKMYLVFEVSDPELKRKIKETWARDYQFQLDGTNLVKA